MTGVSFTVTIDDAAAQGALSAIAIRARHPRPAMDAIGGAMVASTLMRFETETAPSGAPWKPSRRALKTGGKTLTRRGHLRSSLTHAASDDAVDWGSNMAYAAIHQRGGTVERYARSQEIFQRYNALTGAFRFATRSRANFSRWVTIGAGAVTIPARPYLGVDDSDQAEVVRILEGFIARGDA